MLITLTHKVSILGGFVGTEYAAEVDFDRIRDSSKLKVIVSNPTSDASN